MEEEDRVYVEVHKQNIGGKNMLCDKKIAVNSQRAHGFRPTMIDLWSRSSEVEGDSV